MKFPYFKFPSSDPKRKWVSRPLIPISLIGPRDTCKGYALVDSGADRSLFNMEIAEKIGLDFKNTLTENFSGIEGGILRAKIQRVELQVVGMTNKIEINAGFVDTPYVSAILGQEGFFDAYKIRFERDHEIVEIISVKRRDIN